MPYQKILLAIDSGEKVCVRCPDGASRRVWGYNGATGDLFVSGWQGDVWMDCSDGTLRAEFGVNE